MLTESLLYVAVATVAAAGILAWTAYEFHNPVQSFAYPHEIQLNGTYHDRVRYTVTDRLDVPKTLAIVLVLVVSVAGGAVLLTAGAIHLAGFLL